MGAVAVTVNAVSVSGAQILLSTSPATNGKVYTLHIPTGIIKTSDSSAYIGTTTQIFTGVGGSFAAYGIGF